MATKLESGNTAKLRNPSYPLRYNQTTMSLKRFTQFVRLLIGRNGYWRRRWGLETEEGLEEIDNDCNERGLFWSGLRGKERRRYEAKRAAEFKDEERRRLLEGLGVIPSWLSLFLSVLALIVSIVALLK